MRSVLFILMFCMGFAACDKPREIPDDKLEAIVHDIFVANAYGIMLMRSDGVDTMDVYAPIFKKYGYKPADMLYTIDNLGKRKSVTFTGILDSVIMRIERESNRYDSLVAQRDTARERTAERYKVLVYQNDSVKEVTCYQDLEKLAVTLPVDKGTYEVTFNYFLDSLDKNSNIRFHEYTVDSVTNRQLNHIYRSYAKGTRKKEIVTGTVSQDNMKELRLDFAQHNNTTAAVTNLTIDSVRVTFFPPQAAALDSLIREILRTDSLERYKPELYGTPPVKTPLLPLRADSAGISEVGDTLLRQ